MHARKFYIEEMIPFRYLIRTVFFFVLFSFGAKCLPGYSTVDPDLLLNLDELMEKHGYPVEIHEVTTDDGYILTLFRVPHGKNGSDVNPKPILMMHGMFGTAFNFVFTEYANHSMAGYFADHGYDVWLGNARGTTYSRKHVKLDPNKSKFWKFSWHEIGLYDLPATMEYILNVTEKSSLYYIGHSQGGTIFYVLASLRPEYQEKFTQVSLMAPGGLMKHHNNKFIKSVSRNHRFLWTLAQSLNIFELPPPWLKSKEMALSFCVDTILEDLCKGIFFMSSGGDSGEFDSRLFPMMVNTMTSISTMQALHYAQNIDAAKFRPWDYGEEKNQQIYGQSEPPEYPVERIEVPVAIYYGNKDIQAFAEDQREMCRRLQNCVIFEMSNPKWNHYDFLVSKNLKPKLLEPMAKFMEKYDIK